MSDYTNLLWMLKTYEDGYGLYQDAADAIEALQAEVERLQADVDAAYAH